MLKSMSNMFVKTLREDPADAEVASHKLLVRAGYIRRVAPGIYTWLPLGLSVLGKIENIVREEMASIGAQEVHFPALLPREPYEATNRWTEYGPNLFKLNDRRGNDYLLAPTHEEMFTLLVKDMYSSYKDLPCTLYQIQTKYRDEARPRAGLLRGREFVMKDAYSFDIDDEGLSKSYASERGAYEKIFKRLDLEYVIVKATSGAMGGSRSEEFLHPTEIGEDTFVRSAGGYVANVEAVTTVVPDEVDASNIAEAKWLETPNATTIDLLVERSNELYPRQDRPWEASDTMKVLIVALKHPDGERELIAVGIPGNRELDLKRLEANVSPAEVEMATEEDIKAHPELVKGYIGFKNVGPNSQERTVDENGNICGSIRFLVDPRIVKGTSWIMGGDKAEHHVYNAVMGRDFEVDGTIEASEVLEGDLAPDGSGPLYLDTGIEIGHIFALGRKYAEALGLTVLDQNGKSQVVTMGSYGIGISRVLAALVQSHHDDKGIIWPVAVAPFKVHLVSAGKGEEIAQASAKLAESLDKAGLDVLVDDRAKVSPGVKFKDAELLGIPYILVVGRGLENGLVEIKTRATGESIEVPIEEAVSTLEKLVNDALEELGNGN
ncbi:proline--tRNA ligase [Actinomyces sp. zg-332]|uniref:proline--tRNA ligase n=1 Tax=Actinomyces sp. zg-332 TaxID=2708340 RepID=UPI0014220EDA|nr:proline--tRNA ligase [Actinomyces sp. zg-332]QPK94601.1 proline--tRNA ligase [Actinomyces sp. zg-332]